MKSTVAVAACALEAVPGRVEANLDRIEAAAGEAAGRGAELLLLPELSLTGFIPNHPAGDHAAWLGEVLNGAWRMAEPVDGPAVARLMAIAREARMFLAAGLLEHAGTVLYNTHVLVGQGRLWGAWRKMHIPLFEMQVYNGGGAPEAVETPLGRIGVNVCFDAFLPESTRLLGVQNAEIVLFPFAADPAPVTAAGWHAWAGPVLAARCAENGVFGVACNNLGRVDFAGASQRFPGGAVIIGPSGRPLTPVDERFALAELSSEALTAARASFEYTMRFRRPELYARLAGK